MFDWDEGNLDHIARHGVSPEAAEEAVGDPDRLLARAPRTHGEARWECIGRTEAGRTLHVVYTTRQGSVRIVTVARQCGGRFAATRGKDL